MSIELTSKLLNSMQKEIQELIKRNVGAKESALQGSTEKEKAAISEMTERDFVLLLKIIQLIEAQLVTLLKDTVRVMIKASRSCKW